MSNQNYSNHTQIVPAFLALLGILFLTVIGSGVNLYQSIGDHQRLYSAALILVLSASTLGLALHARAFPSGYPRTTPSNANVPVFSAVFTAPGSDPYPALVKIAAPEVPANRASLTVVNTRLPI